MGILLFLGGLLSAQAQGETPCHNKKVLPPVVTSYSEKKEELGDYCVGALGFLKPLSGVTRLSFGPQFSVTKNLFVTMGQEVKKSQLIARSLDYEQSFFALSVAKKSHEAAKNKYILAEISEKHAEKELMRYMNVRKKNGGSAGHEDVLRYKLEIARGEKKVAQSLEEEAFANVSLAQSRLDQSEIRAPMDGFILDICGKIGERTTDQGVVTFSNLDEMEVVAEVHEHDIQHIHLGQKATIHIQGMKDTYTARVSFKGFYVKKNTERDQDPKGDQDLRIVEVRLHLNKQYVKQWRHFIYRQVSVRFLSQSH